MSGVYFYTLILSFASGIFLRSFFIIDWIVVCWLLLVGGGLFVWAYRTRNFVAAKYVTIAAVAIVGCALGIGRYDLAVQQTAEAVLASDVGSVHTYTGQVVREPELATNGKNVVVRIGQELMQIKVDRHAEIRYGDTVSVAGKVTSPESFMTDLGREFNYPGYLRAKGIAYTMAFAQMQVTDTTTGNSILRLLFAFKEQFISVLQNMLPEPQVGLGEGLLLGVNHSLGTDLEAVFRRAGIIHIVVLSGYNIQLVVQFVLLIVARVLPLRTRAVVGVMAIICFALIVGLGASVIRASIMAALGLAALLFDRTYAVTRALFLAGTVMLLVNPYLLVFDIGFQLSFMATLGLLLVSPQLSRLVVWLSPQFGLREFLLATLATQIAVLPLLLYHMGQFSVVSFVVNLLVLPIVSVAMLLTFLTGLVGFISPSLALPFAYAAYGVLAYIIAIATKFSELPFAVIGVSYFPPYAVAVSYGLMGVWLYRKMRRSTSVEVSPFDLSVVQDWTIVEDVDEMVDIKKERVEKTRSDSRAAVLDETTTPIFFR